MGAVFLWRGGGAVCFDARPMRWCVVVTKSQASQSNRRIMESRLILLTVSLFVQWTLLQKGIFTLLQLKSSLISDTIQLLTDHTRFLGACNRSAAIIQVPKDRPQKTDSVSWISAMHVYCHGFQVSLNQVSEMNYKSKNGQLSYSYVAEFFKPQLSNLEGREPYPSSTCTSVYTLQASNPFARQT